MRIALAVVATLCLSSAFAAAHAKMNREKTHYYRLDSMLKRFASHARARHAATLAQR